MSALVVAALVALTAVVVSHISHDSARAPRVDGEKRLSAALLTVSGWTRVAAEKEQGLERFDYCGVAVDVSGAKERAIVKYSPGATALGGPPTTSVVLVVTRFRTPADARRLVGALDRAGRSCPSYREPGSNIRVAIRPTPVDQASDQSIAFQFNTRDPALRGKDMIIRRRSIVSAVEYETAADEFDDTLWHQLRQEAATKLADFGG